MNTATAAVCQDCGKELEGRSDKRFCDDACRKRFTRRSADNAEPMAADCCRKCRQTVAAGEWFCADGQRHAVAERTYLLADAPQQSGHDFNGPLPKTGCTIITNVPPPDLSNWQPGADDEGLGGSVRFINGRFSTSDPEQIYWLDQRGGFCTEAEWEAAWLSPEECRQRREQQAERALAQLRQEIECLKGKAGR
jgi:hypothetical protein